MRIAIHGLMCTANRVFLERTRHQSLARVVARHSMLALVATATVLLLTFSALPATAQQRISGRVITVDSVPVWKAIVRLQPMADTNSYASTLTNEDGRFEFLLTGTHDAPPAQHVLRLDQNYPNPFSRGTTFTFSIPSAGEVQMCMYDRMGRRVRTLVSESLPEGRYSVGWDGCGENGTRLSPGPFHAFLRSSTVSRACLAVLSTHGGAGSAAGLRREAGPVVLSKASAMDYRINANDTVAALPRFISTSLPLALGAADTSLTIRVEYGGWEDLEFPTPNAYRLFFDAPYLYVAALKDGLWRRNVHGMTGWEYLGLSDTALSSWRGVLDVDARTARILVAYNGTKGGQSNLHDRVSLYRSLDGGTSWHRADSTIIASLPASTPNIITGVRSDPSSPQCAVALLGGAGAFVTKDGGATWRLMTGSTTWVIGSASLWWRPGTEGLCYLYFGQSSQGFMCYDTRNDSLVFRTQEPIVDLEFSLPSGERMFRSSGWMYSSSDGGRQWSALTHRSTYGELFYNGVSDMLYGDVGYKLVAFDLVTNREHLFAASAWSMDSDYVFDGALRNMYVIGGGRIHRIRIP